MFKLVLCTVFVHIFVHICYSSDRIVYDDKNGNVSVIVPANSTEEALKDVPSGVQYKIVQSEELPSRRFRNAWKLERTGITVDPTKAREIRKKEILELRNKKIIEEQFLLDKALDEGDNQTEKLIRNKRIKLRNLDSLDLSTMPIDEHGAFLPEVLK